MPINAEPLLQMFNWLEKVSSVGVDSGGVEGVGGCEGEGLEGVQAEVEAGGEGLEQETGEGGLARGWDAADED
jgi:hypothetical protein